MNSLSLSDCRMAGASMSRNMFASFDAISAALLDDSGKATHNFVQ